LNNTGSFKKQNQRTFSEGNLTEGGTTLKKRLALGSVIAVLVVALFALAALASSASVYFSNDKNGVSRVNNVQEGDEVWVVVFDPDENIDCDVRDKIWPDLKIMDPKTGAYIVWNSEEGDLGTDYLEETDADTGLFVSKRSFQIGTRVGFVNEIEGTHTLPPEDFQWGNYSYVDGTRGWFDCLGAFETGGVPAGEGPGDPPMPFGAMSVEPMQAEPADFCGRFENMDTLVVMYQDPNEFGDVAVGMAKIVDTTATIKWSEQTYKDGNGSAKITVTDQDENINCNKAEYVPVFVIVNPGSWNPVDAVPEQGFSGESAANFCMLKTFGGVDPADGTVLDQPIRWYNIYDSGLGGPYPDNGQPASEGAYYIEYPTVDEYNNGDNVTFFETTDPDGYCRAMFYAQETGVDTGVFELNINSLLVDLGFDRLDVGDVLAAYYLDPNDFDDFALDVAYIETRAHVSTTTFTNATRVSKDSEFWIGRDPVYIQVIDENANRDACCPEQVVVHVCDPHEDDDSEWIILDETSSNSPVFFSNAGTQLWAVWDALGVGLQGDPAGGFQLRLDNWKLEVYNEDAVYARYNDVDYTEQSKTFLGDIDTTTEFPPQIARSRVANDISFDLLHIGDNQVFDGGSDAPSMYFLDRQGNRVSGYANSDCLFVAVEDVDQDEDQYRRERVDGFWDGQQNFPFGPQALNEFECDFDPEFVHEVNPLLGDTNIFNTGDRANLYVLNPRNGRWAAVDLLETGVSTGKFVSVTCIELGRAYVEQCAPSLDVNPGDTIIAAYQDPSNHSDSAWISVKVGMGGGITPPSQLSTTVFVDADGDEVDSYTDDEDVFVKVIDPSQAGNSEILDAVEIDEVTYDLSPLEGAANDTFITEAISGLGVGAVTATYTDPGDPTDTSSDTINIVASELVVEEFYAGPNPFSTTVDFAYRGTGIATEFSVTVYDLSGKQVWASGTKENVDHITWDGSGLANGGYIYVAVLSGFADDQAKPFRGTVFISR
jgi:hypothetical protein